ncbi:MAG: glycosyltransferase family 39 protein [Nitrospinota bacterium]|nr:glycosyltransferase family 39 protein [Nitrospinota bacterium]
MAGSLGRDIGHQARMMLSRVKYVFNHILTAVLALYALVLLYYFSAGPFDYSLLGARIYLDDWVKPFQILLVTAILKALVFVLSDESLRATLAAPFCRARRVVAERQQASLVALILAYAMGLRLWSLAQGSQDRVFYEDAIHFISVTWHYLGWNYLHETGYPDLSSHFTEWMVRFITWLAPFMGFHPLQIDWSLINTSAMLLNLVYSAVTFWLIYQIGVLIGRKDAAILTLFLVGVSLTELQANHYYINDIPMSVLALCGVYFAALNLKEEKTSYYIIAGVFIALAVASKYNGALSFIYVGFIYLRLHPTPVDFWRNLDKPFKMLVAFGAFVLLAHPTLFVDPGARFDYVMKRLYFMTRPRGLGDFSEESNTFWNHFKVLFTHLDYHLWAIKGLIDPLPLWLGATALGFVAWKHRWNMAFLWASPIIFIILGRFTKPNSAPFHYLNLIPLLLLVVSIGILDGLKTVPSRLARGVLLSIMVLWGAYQGLQDTSYWSLPPTFKIAHNWLTENLDYNADVLGPKDLVQMFQGDPRKIREVYTGPERWSYVLHRDARHYIVIHNGMPVLFPPTQFPSQRQVATIFPASYEVAVTERVFATGPEAKMFDVRRYIMADEAPELIAVLAQNSSLKENAVSLNIGGDKYRKKLKPGESALFTAPVEENRTFLLEGRYVRVEAHSEEDAVWTIAARDDDLGDLLMDTGSKGPAVEHYRKSGSAYALLRIMALDDASTGRIAAAKKLKEKFPALFATMTTLPPDQWTFQNLAGWDDEYFRVRMTRHYRYDEFNLDHIPEAGLTLGPRSNIWGPYTPVMKGDYMLDIQWLTHGAGLESLLLDVATRRVPNNEIVRTISGAEVRAGSTTLNIMVENPADFPFEVMVGQVKGGAVGVGDIALTIDYEGQIKRSVQAALEGTGKEALDGL